MSTVLSVLLWIPVAAVKIALVILGLVVVPLWVKVLRKDPPPLWRFGTNRPHTAWEAAVRNPVGGFGYLIQSPAEYKTYGCEIMEPTQQDRAFSWRFRIAKLLSSLRLVWKYSSTRYGELYVGWKLGSDLHQLDFALSLRPWNEIGT